MSKSTVSQEESKIIEQRDTESGPGEVLLVQKGNDFAVCYFNWQEGSLEGTSGGNPRPQSRGKTPEAIEHVAQWTSEKKARAVYAGQTRGH